MKRSLFIVLLAGIAVFGIVVLSWQRREIARAELSASASDENSSPQSGPGVPDSQASPSAELLRLRNEVTLLSKDLAETKQPANAALPPKSASDWEEIHSGPKLSEQTGFVAITSLSPAGNTTPADAFQTLQFALRNQDKEPLTDTKMKEIWDVPDDFDDPNARYSIGLGQGIGGETGYRVVREQVVSSNEVMLVLDFEMEDGGATRQERVVAYRNGRWRVKPDSVKRQF